MAEGPGASFLTQLLMSLPESNSSIFVFYFVSVVGTLSNCITDHDTGSFSIYCLVQYRASTSTHHIL